MKFHELPVGVPCSVAGSMMVFCKFARNCSHEGIGDGSIFEMGTGHIGHITEIVLATEFDRNDFGIVNHYGEIEV